MPIAVNGSGTITGISVGGLPDGIVDADMLAANAVTTGKLASGILQAKCTPSNLESMAQASSSSDSYVDVQVLMVNFITPLNFKFNECILVVTSFHGTAAEQNFCTFNFIIIQE